MNETNQNETDNASISLPVAEQSTFGVLNETISNAIQSSGERIKNIFIDKQVNDEVTKRAGLLGGLVASMLKFKKDLGRFNKADNISYNLDGSVASQYYSKKFLDDRKKALEKFTKAEKVLAQALNENDYSKVEQTTKELSAGGQPNANESKGESNSDNS